MSYDPNPYDNVTVEEALKQLFNRFTPRTVRQAIFTMAEGGGGGGFTPTDAQLDAMNSGITSEDVEQISTNKNNILSKIGASDYATQNTGGTVRVWTTTDGTDTILHIANEAPTP